MARDVVGMHRRVNLLTPSITLLVAVVLGLAGCGDDDNAGGDEAVPDDPDAVVVAENVAFDTDELTIPAAQPATIVIDNRDEGVDHNLHIEDAPPPNKTPLREGVSQQALTVTLDKGEYSFVCDIHPNMRGVIIAE